MHQILRFVWLAGVLGAQTAPSPGVPEHPFIPLNGPYAVGVHEFLWIDQKREEPFTRNPNDRRHVLARVWSRLRNLLEPILLPTYTIRRSLAKRLCTSG